MDAAALEATFEKNKIPILAAAGAGVVGLALISRKKNAAAGAGDAAVSQSAGGQVAATTGGAAYDSSASDLYGAVQPQLEALGSQLTDLRNLWSTQSSPTPVPAGTTAPGGSTDSGTTLNPSTPTQTSPTRVYLPNNYTDDGPYSTPTSGVKGPIGSSVYDSAGNSIGAVTSYTFNGMPNVNYNAGTSLAQAEESSGLAGTPKWTKQSNGTYQNQWGNVATGLDQYGTPIFG